MDFQNSWRVQQTFLLDAKNKKNELCHKGSYYCCVMKYSCVFRENRCLPPPKPVYDGNFSHEAVTLKIRSRSPKSNKLLIMFDLYRLANLVIFHPMIHEKTCRQTLFGLNLVDKVWQWPWKPDQGIQLFITSKCYIHANLVKIRQLVHEILGTQAPIFAKGTKFTSFLM